MDEEFVPLGTGSVDGKLRELLSKLKDSRHQRSWMYTVGICWKEPAYTNLWMLTRRQKLCGKKGIKCLKNGGQHWIGLPCILIRFCSAVIISCLGLHWVNDVPVSYFHFKSAHEKFADAQSNLGPYQYHVEHYSRKAVFESICSVVKLPWNPWLQEICKLRWKGGSTARGGCWTVPHALRSWWGATSSLT